MNTCPACGTTYPLLALSCLRCQALTHRARLVELSNEAEAFADTGASDAESKLLEQMLELLPARAAQAQTIRARLAALGKAKPRARPVGKLAGLGALGLVLWKLKALVLLALGKGKVLLLGLTKAKTLFSMAVSLGLYWSVWGWQFALGFVVSLYFHEMGHVAALRRMGIPASSPMFIPFVGAYVRLKVAPRNTHEDAVVGLAGPLLGLFTALVCYAVYLATGASIFGALARAGAWLNLFNLVPIWQLDGGRGFNAMTRRQQWHLTALIGLMLALTGEGLLVLLLLGCAYRLFARPAAKDPDPRAEWTYAALIVTLSALSQIRLPGLE